MHIILLCIEDNNFYCYNKNQVWYSEIALKIKI